MDKNVAAAPRILFVGAGQSPHIHGWEAYFVRRGYRAHLLTWRQPGVPGSAEEPGVKVHYLPGERLLSRAGLGPLRSFWAGLVIRYLARRHRIDLLHAHQVIPYGFWAALGGKLPLVVTAWGSDLLTEPYASPRAMRYARAALRAADLVTADSDHLRLAAGKLGYNGPSAVVPVGVDTALFRPGRRDEARAALGIAPDVPLVLSPRALSPVYNIDVLIRSIPAVVAAVPGVRYIFKYGYNAGREDELKALAERLGVGAAVDFAGSSPVERMAQYQAAADVCVSIAASDSAPKSVLEALACGTPVVLSDLAWVHEYLADGREVLLVPASDADAVAQATIRLLRDPALRQRLGEAGRGAVVQHADYERAMARMDRLYRALLERRPLPLEGTG